jgi:hypothetical protein
MLVDQYNAQANAQADNVYQQCLYNQRVSDWQHRQGDYKDPFENSNFRLDGRSGIAYVCQTGDPENNLDNQNACRSAAQKLGVPYYNDYSTTFSGQSDNPDCNGKWWMPICRRVSNDQYNNMNPGVRPFVPQTIPSVGNVNIQCCDQRVNLDNLRANNIDVHDINLQCNNTAAAANADYPPSASPPSASPSAPTSQTSIKPDPDSASTFQSVSHTLRSSTYIMLLAGGGCVMFVILLFLLASQM